MISAEAVRMGKAAVSTETVTAIGVASAAFLAANPNRIAFSVFNGTAGSITISSKATAILGSGIVLPAGGQTGPISISDYGPSVAGAWTAIAPGAVTVNVFETVLQTG